MTEAEKIDFFLYFFYSRNAVVFSLIFVANEQDETALFFSCLAADDDVLWR